MPINIFTPLPPLPSPAPGGTAAPAPQTTPTTPAPQSEPPVTPQSALQTALATLRQTSASKQDGMAGLMANALRVLTSPSLPPQVQAAVQQLAALHLPTDKMPTPADIKAAMQNSGLFTEAELGKSGEPPADLKTALGRLNAAARDWAAQNADAEKPELPAQSPSVPPPTRGAAPAGQAAASATLPKGADPAMAAKLLEAGSDAALARQNLLQLASLPDPQQTKPEPRYVLDMPLMTPQGPAVAQLVVERDSRGTSAERPEPVWRVALALNLEPLGPVRANLALCGEHAWVTIAAERPEALEKLQKESGWLNDALTGASLEADVAFQSTAKTASNPALEAYRKGEA